MAGITAGRLLKWQGTGPLGGAEQSVHSPFTESLIYFFLIALSVLKIEQSKPPVAVFRQAE